MKNHIFVILSVLAWGSSQFLQSRLLLVIPPANLLFFRFLFSGIILLLLVRKTKVPFRIKYFLTGGLGCFSYYLLSTYALEMTNVSFVAIMSGCLPVLAMLSDIFFARSRPGIIKIVAVFFSVFGIVLYSYGSKIVWNSLAFLLIVIANIAWLIYCYLKKKWRTGDDLKILGYEFVASAILFLPFLFPYHAPKLLALEHFFSLGIVVIVSTILPYWLYAKGSAKLPLTTSAIYMNLLPLSSLLPVWMTQKNNLTGLQFVAVFILLLSSVGNVLGDGDIVNSNESPL